MFQTFLTWFFIYFVLFKIVLIIVQNGVLCMDFLSSNSVTFLCLLLGLLLWRLYFSHKNECANQSFKTTYHLYLLLSRVIKVWMILAKFLAEAVSWVLGGFPFRTRTRTIHQMQEKDSCIYFERGHPSSHNTFLIYEIHTVTKFLIFRTTTTYYRLNRFEDTVNSQWYGTRLLAKWIGFIINIL